jgi:hypothetical protein
MKETTMRIDESNITLVKRVFKNLEKWKMDGKK